MLIVAKPANEAPSSGPHTSKTSINNIDGKAAVRIAAATASSTPIAP